MKRYKFVIILIAVALTIFLISCTEDLVSPIDKKVEIIEELSIVHTKVQFGVDRIYHYKIAVESNYLPTDSLIVLTYFTNGSTSVKMEMYDDGFSDSLLQNDIVASNNIWSGGINSNFFPSEGDWKLNVEIFILDSTLISEHIFSNIIVNTNTAPIIDNIVGIAEGDSLIAGFDTKNLIVSITDPDNDALGYNDNQTLKLEIRNRDNIDKDYEYVREDPLSSMDIRLDSTLASELATNDRYTLTFIATDYYGESDSLSFENIRIENTAPILSELNYPDTVFIPTADSTYFSVTVNVNDPQGHLESQDIQNVELILDVSGSPVPFEMRDDGDINNSGDVTANDGIYTKNFKVRYTNLEDTYPLTITATDKVGNISNELSGELIFIKDTKSKTNRVNDAEKFNYSNPFNTK